MATDPSMDFVPMKSIVKKPDSYIDQCTDWVATEKVHGSSFQLYISDGLTVNVGSRRRALDKAGSFLKCSIKGLLREYDAPALRLWQILKSDDRWATYRESFVDYGDDEDENDDDDDGGDEDKTANDDDDITHSKDGADESSGRGDYCHLRIYGELYGGGGVTKDVKSAIQKEIIYCDDFRLYVFGLTINRKWLTIAELDYLCREAGFPYHATAVCEPKKTMEELKQFLLDSGFMRTRSTVTDKKDDVKTAIEGVVMTPLCRPDYRLHAVKFLAPAFSDVRVAQFCSKKTTNYCTKQRYHSVISKLDTHERQDTPMVVDMFIADIIKESGDASPAQRLKDVWTKLVTQWLKEDGYIEEGGGEDGEDNETNNKRKSADDDNDDNDDGDMMGMGLFDL